MSLLFTCDHEEGDFTDYTTTVTDGGDLSVAAGAALNGTSYGMSVLIDDLVAIYGRKVIASPDTSGIFRASFYIDPNTITMPNSGLVIVLRAYSSLSDAIALVHLGYATATGYRIRANLYDDSSGNHYTGYYDITDASHLIEIIATKSDGSNNGTIELLIDGVSKETLTGVDNDTRFGDFEQVRMGAVAGISTGVSGTFYLDELNVYNDSGTVEYTLTATAGSYTLSGQAVNLTQALKLVSEAGSFSLSGQTVDLLMALKLAAAAGAFDWSGLAVDFPRTYQLVAGAGSYALTGQDVTLIYGLVMTANPGSFALSGQAVDLLQAFKLGADAGTYALSGQAIALLLALKLPADSGTFNLTGQAADFWLGIQMIAEAGSFEIYEALTVKLEWGHVLAAALGSFILTGQDVILNNSGDYVAATYGRLAICNLKWNIEAQAADKQVSISNLAQNISNQDAGKHAKLTDVSWNIEGN